MGIEQDRNARVMNWTASEDFQGWVCSRCGWTYPMPALLADPAAKSAYDRLAAGKFSQHNCESCPVRPKATEPLSFTPRIRKLVAQGFKPKDAVEILLQEVAFESRNDASALARARADGEDFLRRMREGLL
jgi:hypothetical protein